METKIISVERILQYTSIPSEPPLVVERNRPHDSWPSCGRIDIHNLQVIGLVNMVEFYVREKDDLNVCLIIHWRKGIYT